MALPSNLGELTLNTIGEAIAFAAGVALSPTLAPVAHAIEQEAWKVAPVRVVDPGTAAGIAAERVTELPWAADQAIQGGLNDEIFTKLYQLALNAPGFGELLQMYRRSSITEEQFVHGLNKMKLEDSWNAPLETLLDDYLSPAEIATAIQRGQLHDPGYLPVDINTAGSTVPPPEVSDLDPVTEAAAAGTNSERLAVKARLVGLPPAPGELMSLLNRGTINEAAFNLGVSQGNTRNEWASVLMTLKRRLLTPHEYEEANLRGVLEPDAAHAGAALSGMEQADAELLFEIMGRSLAVHQITTGLERGGTYGGTYDDIPEPYRDAVRRSSIRPEYAVLAYANRYTVPSYFILKAILSDGGMTPDQFAQYGKELGWPPDLADSAAKALSTGTAAKGDPYVTKANTQLWNTIHTAYVDSRADDQLASSTFDALGVTTHAQPVVLDLWKQERGIHRVGLTAAQIKKTVGLPGWTDAERMTRLADLGYSTEDATTFLAEG